MLRLKFIILILIILSGHSYAQNENYEFRAWKLMSYSGNVGVGGFYRQQSRTLQNFVDRSKFPYVLGKFALYTRSYIGHPNLFMLDVGGEFNPGTSRQNYTVSPDRSEVLTFSRLNIRGFLLSGKPMNLSGSFDIGQNLITREYVSSLRTNHRQWGLKYQYVNKILPLYISFQDRKLNQLEIETGRTFRDKQSDLVGSVKKSFTKLGDRNELKYTRYKYFRENQNFVQIRNDYDKWELFNTYFFDHAKKYLFKSYINTLNQRGVLNQDRIQSFQNVNFKLPRKFRFNANYRYIKTTQERQRYTQNGYGGGLEHQLYNSLRTGLIYDYIKTVNTAYTEKRITYGFNVNYIKKIPTNGTLNLIYNYTRRDQNVVANPDSIIIVTNEEHILVDNQVILLNRPYIDLESVIVKDEFGSIIYQRDVDYLLIERREYTEIKRVPGGQIPNNALVLVDYEAAQIGSYNFTTHINSFTARVSLFERLVEMYYTYINQDYTNVESPNFVTLNYFKRNIFGLRIQYKFINAGVERDIYNSTIVPYEKWRYFLQMDGKIGKKILLSMNGDVTDLTLTETNTDQLYASIFGKAVYLIKPRMKVNLDLEYRKQVGDEIDLDLIRAKTEFNTSVHKIYIRLGLEVYRRYYISEQIDYWGVYFQVERRF